MPQTSPASRPTKAKNIGYAVTLIALLAAVGYPLVDAGGWTTAIILLAAVPVVLVVALLLARRHEPIALLTAEATPADERRTLLTLRSRAIAGRAAVYGSLIVALTLMLLETLYRHWGIPTTTTETINVLNTHAAPLAFPCVIYIVTRIAASMYLSRKG